MASSGSLQHGDTPLHIAVRNLTSLTEFKSAISIYSEEDLIKWASTTNHKGEIPFLMAFNTPLNYKERLRVQKIIASYTTKVDALPLATPVNKDEILMKYQYLSKGDKTIIADCVDAINEKVDIELNSSHPSVNNIPEKFLELHGLIYQYRCILDSEDEQKVGHTCSNLVRKRNALESNVKFYKDESFGNCNELAEIVYLKLHEKYPNSLMLSIKYFDHVVIVVESKFILCPLTGLVCLISELPENLRGLITTYLKEQPLLLYPFYNRERNSLREFATSSIYEQTLKEDKLVQFMKDPATLSTQLIFAARQNKLREVKRLLEQKADPNFMIGLSGFMSEAGGSILSIASTTQICEVLLEAKADPNVTDGTGRSPLIDAVSTKATDKVKLLLKHKARPNQANYKGCTSLFFAETVETVTLLLAAKADPNVKNNKGETPAIAAAESDYLYGKKARIVAALLCNPRRT